MMFGKKETIVLKIEGMRCVHCQAKVEKALKAATGVTDVSVSLEEATATVTVRAGKTDAAALVAVVKAAGFDATV